jgi:hypothetical protein
MKKPIAILTIASILLNSCGNETPKQDVTVQSVETTNPKDQTKQTTPPATKKLDVVFDIPALIDKNIDQIKKTLGKPSSGDEPTKQQMALGVTEWDKTFEKNGYELLITYNPKTRKVIDFFIPTNNSSGKTNDYDDLLQIANVKDNTSKVRVKPVQTLSDPNSYTGIKVTKK